MHRLQNPATRRAIYRTVAATLGLLASYGIISGDDVRTWMDLTTELLAVAGLLLAANNVDVSEQPGPSEETVYWPEDDFDV